MPEKIENIYVNSQYVEQVFVHGESLKVRFLFVYINNPVNKFNFENAIKLVDFLDFLELFILSLFKPLNQNRNAI